MLCHLQGDSDGVASITSSTLENVFQADIDTEISFSVGKHKYILYLKGTESYEGVKWLSG